MRRAYRLLGWALLVSGAPSACGSGEIGDTASGPGAGGAAGATSASSTSGGGGGGAGGEDGAGGAGAAPTGECAALASGPIAAEPFADVFGGNEDFAFDGQGYLVAKRGSNLVRYDSTRQFTNFASLPGTVLGLRYRPDGSLVAARPDLGTVVQISTDGDVNGYVSGLQVPNGLSPDTAGNVWATESAGDRILRLSPDATIDVVASGAPEVSQPNGIFIDEQRNLLFYTNASAGEIRRIALSASDDRPVLVATVPSAVLEGLALDACGHLYVLDSMNRELYRVRLDAVGAAVGEPELLATFPTAVSNAQFGSGPGFKAKSLYVGGAAGPIYAVDVGIGGAPVPAPPVAP